MAPPTAIIAATDEDLAEEDAVARWIEECCVTGKHQWGIGAKLWGSWKVWSEANNEWTGTRKSFTQALNDRGFTPEQSQHVRGHLGIDLRASDHGERAVLA